MKPLVIYHANCADGFGAAFAAWLKLGDDADYFPVQYGEYGIEPMAHAVGIGRLINQKGNLINFIDREVYILDFSFPRETMEILFATAKRVVWLDHHHTSRAIAEDMCPSQPYPVETHQERFEIVHDNDRSGAMLAWEYFHPDIDVPMMIRHIDDYDRWQFKLNDTKEFNKALWSYAPWSFEQWAGWDHHGVAVEVGATYQRFITDGAAILRAHDQNVQSVVKGAPRKCKMDVKRGISEEYGQVFEHFTGLAANCPSHLTSDVGHELANQSGTFGLCWALNKDNKCLCSLRSNGDYDVSTIAKVFGGGGHKNAAGFEIPIDTLLEWLK